MLKNPPLFRKERASTWISAWNSRILFLFPSFSTSRRGFEPGIREFFSFSLIIHVATWKTRGKRKEFANSRLKSTSRRGFWPIPSSLVTEKATSRRGFSKFAFSGREEGFRADRGCLVDSLEPRFAIYFQESVRWKKEGFPKDTAP